MRLKGLQGFAYLSACFLLTFLSVLNPTRVQAQNQYSQNKEVISDASSSFVGIADGDIDLDGLPDVAICDRGLDQVVLLLNTSSGLRSRVDISLKDFMSQLDDQSGGPTSIDMGDIDQDGDLDIVVSIDGDLDQILVLTNLGGGFGPESFVIRAYPVGGDPTCIKLADLTGPKDLATGETLPRDGAPEIVMLNRRTGTVATLINSGYGTFGQGRVSESGGINPVSQALGDFNDDGEIDTAVLNRGLDTTQREDSRVCVLLGNGDGSFQPTNPLLLAPSRAVSIAAAGYGVVHRGVEIDIPDINRDGITDIAVVAEQGGGASDIIAPDGSNELASLTVFFGSSLQNGQFTLRGQAQPLVNTVSGGGRIAVYPGADDKLTGLRIGYGALTLFSDFNQNGQIDAYVAGLERNNGRLVNSAVGQVANDFAAGLMTADQLAVQNPILRYFNVFPSTGDSFASIAAQAPDNIDSISGVVAATSFVVSRTGEIVTQAQNDFSSTTGNNAPDLVQVTTNGNVYQSINVAPVVNHAPLMTTANGLADFNGRGRKVIVAEGDEYSIPLKLIDIDNPSANALRYTLLGAPRFVTLTDNFDGTASILIKPGLLDGSNTANNGLGQEYKIVAQVTDNNFPDNDNNSKSPLTSQVIFRVFVPDSMDGLAITTIPDQTAYATQKLTVPILARDPENRRMTLSTSSTLPFVRIIDQGGGTGLFVIEPTENDGGVYDIDVIVRNDLGLTTTTSFAVNVVVNTAPELEQVDDVSMLVAETQEFQVTATDPDEGQSLRFVLTNAPAFITFSDNGDGTGRIVAKPSEKDAGSYRVLLVAIDSGIPSKRSNTIAFTINVGAKVSLSSVNYTKKRMFLSGSGFGSNATVLINGQAVPASLVLPGSTDNSITLIGNKKKLNLRAGSNSIQVRNAGGQESSVFYLQL